MPRLLSPRNLALIAGAGVIVYYYPRKATQSQTSSANSLPGVQNIADRFSAGGGSTTHSPGAATKRGDPASVQSPQESPSGVGSVQHQDRHADQKIGEPGVLGKKWNEMHHGNEKGR